MPDSESDILAALSNPKIGDLNKPRFYKYISIALIVIISIGLAMVLYQPVSDITQESTIIHTSTTDTSCINGKCTLTLYSGIRNVYEDGEWKRAGQAKSLKDNGFYIEYLEKNNDFIIDIIDFNYSSITVVLSISNPMQTGKDIPLRIWRFDEVKNEYSKLS